MVKKVSFEISDEIFEELSELANYYKIDLGTMFAIILKTVSCCKSDITSLSRLYEQKIDLEQNLINALRSYPNLYEVFRQLPKRVGVEGEFYIDLDMELSFDGDYFRVGYDIDAETNRYNISRIDFLKQEKRYCFSAKTYINLKDISKNELEKLYEVIKEVSDPFDLESFNIEIDDGYENQRALIIDCWNYTIDSLPKIKQVDKLTKKILKQSGINLKK